MHVRIGVVVFVGILASVLAGLVLRPVAARGAPADADDIAGLVTDEKTLRPIAGAFVSVWRRSRPLQSSDDYAADIDWPAKSSRSARTDARGAFRFPAEPSAPVRWITVSASGYASTAVEVPTGQEFRDVMLRAAAPRRCRYVKPTPSGPAPAAGAEILLLTAGPRRLLAGRFAIGADGFAIVPCLESDSRVAHGPGIATQFCYGEPDRDCRLEAGGPVAGAVTKPDGAPVAGITVRIGRRNQARVALTDATGKFRLEGIPCGEETVSLTASGGGASCAPIEVQGGDLAVSVVVAPPARVRGRIVDANGKPVAGATVWIHTPRDEGVQDGDPFGPRPTGPTGPDGRFEVDGLPAGTTVFRATTGTAASGDATVVIPPTATRPDVEIRVSAPAISLPVRALDESGNPLAGFRIEEWSPIEARNGAAPARTANDGSADVPLQRRFTSLGHILDVTGPLEGDPKGYCVVPVVAARAGRVDIVVVRRPARLRIRAFDADGNRVPEDELVVGDVENVPGGPALARLGVDVQFVLGPGPRLVPRSTPFRLRVVSSATGSEWTGTCCGNGVTGEFLDLEVRFPRRTRVGGRIATQTPSAGLVAAAIPEDRSDVRTNLLGAPVPIEGGAFQFDGLTPGPWWILALRDSDAPELLARKQVRIPGTGAAIVLGDLTSPVVTLRGTVRSRGQPVPAADVRVHLAPGLEVPVRSSPDGVWMFRLPAGFEGRFDVSRDGWGTASREFKAGADTTIDVELAPTGTLVLTRGRDRFGLGLPVRVRSGGLETEARVGTFTGDAVVRTAGPGPVEIVIGEGPSARTLRAEVTAGRTTLVDLGGE